MNMRCKGGKVMEKNLAYVNGVITGIESAVFNVDDRGYQYGEAIYEVIMVYNAKPFALLPHLSRLERSAKGIQLRLPWSSNELEKIIMDLLKKSGLKSATIYIQITSGTAPRSFLVEEDIEPNLVIIVRSAPEINTLKGIKVVSFEDIRWKKCWIKSTNLLGAVLAKKAARQRGGKEVIMFEPDGRVTEGGSSNIFAVIKGVVVTPDLNHNILPGITRKIVLEIAQELGIPYQECAVYTKEIETAEEIIITSTTFEVTSAIQFNDMVVGNGVPGPIAQKLYSSYMQKVYQECF